MALRYQQNDTSKILQSSANLKTWHTSEPESVKKNPRPAQVSKLKLVSSGQDIRSATFHIRRSARLLEASRPAMPWTWALTITRSLHFRVSRAPLAIVHRDCHLNAWNNDSNKLESKLDQTRSIELVIELQLDSTRLDPTATLVVDKTLGPAINAVTKDRLVRSDHPTLRSIKKDKICRRFAPARVALIP
ncbi:hypothetical protein C8R44DRAFT_741149 [Mycena epipterygia]|nr:hypothetical protein C8R44DRAFT_741149 [Mycena epipterygia]